MKPAAAISQRSSNELVATVGVPHLVEDVGMSAVLRACAVCAKPSAKGYCSEHEPKPWASSKRKSRLTLSGSKEQARRKRVLARYLDTCHVCGKRGADQVDHVVPLAEGGSDDELNLAPIHSEPCHREKTAEESRRARLAR